MAFAPAMSASSHWPVLWALAVVGMGFASGELASDAALLAVSRKLSRQLSQTNHHELATTALSVGDAENCSGSGATDAACTEPMLAYVQTLAARVTNGTEEVDDEMIATLEAMRQQMQQLSNTSQLNLRLNQNVVDLARDNVAQCENTTDAAAARTDDRERSHAECRTEQAGLSRLQTEACGSLAELHQNPQMPDCMPTSTTPVTNDEEIQRCLEKISIWLGSYNASFVASKASCDARSTAHETKVNECNMAQAALETSLCDQHDRQGDSCLQYTTCRDSMLAERDVLHAEVKITEAGQRSAIVAVAKVQCYLGVLAAEHAKRPALLENCTSLQPSTSHPAIVYHPAPQGGAQCTASDAAAAPCDQEWVAGHYQSKPWHATAPTAACMSCAWQLHVLLSGALPSEGGGSAGQTSYTTPTGWTVSSNLKTYANDKLYWLSNVVDGSEACHPSTASTRSMQHGQAMNAYWIGVTPSGLNAVGSDWLQVQMEKARYVDHLELEPIIREDTTITHFRILADDKDVTPSTLDATLAEYHAGTKWDQWEMISGPTCDALLVVNIKAVIRTIRLADFTGKGHVGFGEVRLVGTS